MTETINKKKYYILKEKNIYKALLVLALPLMFSNFLRSIHDLVDMYFVSKPLGETAVASISITWPIIFFTMSIGMGLSIGGTALISQNLGANKIKAANKTATQLFILNLFLGLVMNVLLFFLVGYILQWMGAKGELLALSKNYVRIRSFEMIPLFVYFAFQSSRQSTGDTVTPVVLASIAVVLNTVLTPVLISQFGLGVAGAAYGTLIANTAIIPFGIYFMFTDTTHSYKLPVGLIVGGILGSIALFIYSYFILSFSVIWSIVFGSSIAIGLISVGVFMLIYETQSQVRLDFRCLIPDRKLLIALIVVGLPAAAAQSFTSIGFGVLNSIVLSFGEETVSAFSIGNRISSLVMLPVMGIGGVLGAFIGQNVGALNKERARAVFSSALRMSLFIMITGALLVIPFRRVILETFFFEPGPTLELSVEYMFFLLAGLPLMAVFQTFLGAFSGTGHTKYSLVLSVTRLWILRIPMVWIATNVIMSGSQGIWYSMLASNILAAIVGYILYSRLTFEPKVEVDDYGSEDLELVPE